MCVCVFVMQEKAILRSRLTVMRQSYIPSLTEKPRYPFRIPFIDKWYLFHLPSLEFCILFNCCNALSLKYE